MMALSLAWRQFRSNWAAGELRILLLALVLAVAAATAVGFFTDRIQAGLTRQGSQLLGADLVISSDHAIPPKYLQQAGQLGLVNTQTSEFSSMVVKGERSQLAEIKAVAGGFPLRGALTVSSQLHTVGHAGAGIPQPGQVWIEPRLASQLGLTVGDSVEVGERRLRVAAILQREPSRGGDLFSIAPRLMMNQQDVASTGLIQFGSRVKYQLLLASTAGKIRDYADWAKPQLGAGERLESVTDARPEMRSLLDKAQQFLGLAATVSVMLAMVAMFLASLPYTQKSLDSYALMRCLGAPRRTIMQVLLWQTVFLGLVGSLLGSLLGFIAQSGLSALAGRLLLESLPAPRWMPLLAGFIVGFTSLLAIVWPHLRLLAAVPALRILRRDQPLHMGAGWRNILPAFLLMLGLIVWQAQSIRLGAAIALGLLGLLLGIMMLAWLASRLLGRLQGATIAAWQLGIASLRRHRWLTLAQVAGLSMGLMALLLLSLVRNDLLNNWQAALPADAPNRFIINIQPAQVAGVQAFMQEIGLMQTAVLPMVRGRLVAINGRPLDTAAYRDERARRLAEREFNLSWAAQMQSDNQLLAGHWWTPAQHGQPMLSLEQGLADTLGIRLGDRLNYEIGGSSLQLTVSSLRKVQWNSLRANFFAVTPPGVLDGFPASYITSFQLPLGQEEQLNRLIRRFPNLTVIDVAELMEQVRAILGKMTHAVEYVFGFSLLAGIAVLYAAMAATREERLREAGLLRVLGASRRQVLHGMLAEFFCIGLLAAAMAGVAANGLAWYVSVHLLDIPYRFNAWLTLGMLAAALLLIPAAAWLVARRLIAQPPRQILQSI